MTKKLTKNMLKKLVERLCWKKTVCRLCQMNKIDHYLTKYLTKKLTKYLQTID